MLLLNEIKLFGVLLMDFILKTKVVCICIYMCIHINYIAACVTNFLTLGHNS